MAILVSSLMEPARNLVSTLYLWVSHGLGADVEGVPYLADAVAVGQQTEDFLLARREHADVRPALGGAEALAVLAHEGRHAAAGVSTTEEDLPLPHGIDGLEQDGRRIAFADVAHDAQLDELQQMPLVLVTGIDEDARLGPDLEDGAAGFHAVHARAWRCP